MTVGFSCVACGYALDDALADRAAACPECGVLASNSREQWHALGGERAAIERLLRGSSLAATLSIFLACVWTGQSLFPAPAALGSVSAALFSGTGGVVLALGIVSWCLWLRTAQGPPFHFRAQMPRFTSVLLLAWLMSAGLLVIVLVAPNEFSLESWRRLAVYMAQAAVFPLPLAMAVRSQRAAPPLDQWRKRTRPSALIATALIVMVVVYYMAWVIIDLGPQPLGDDFLYDTAGIVVRGLWAIVAPLLLGVLAILQLMVARHAALALGPEGGVLVRSLGRRRTPIGAALFPVVLLLFATSSHSSLSAWVTTPLSWTEAFLDLHSQVTSDGQAAIHAAVAVGGTEILWVLASMAPVFACWRRSPSS